ncbi:MAG: hypothetical protein Q4D80_01970 [Pseudomonadota bacterium]|nr:hypothetical protein [Pseudomonadota bacterium]
MKKSHYLFVGIVLCFLVAPLGYILGIKAHTPIYGVENIVELPSLQNQSFLSKEFQKNFEEWWQSHYMLRTIFLKTKNQLYDIFNLGKIHSGFNETVIEGSDNYLYSRGYFLSYRHTCTAIPPEFNKIKELKDIADKKNISVYFVLAANKAVIYPQYIPSRYRFFYDNNCDYYNQIEQKLKEMGINVYNSQKLLSSIAENETYQPYNKTGTHWNYYGAGRVFQASAEMFNFGKIELRDIETRSQKYGTERDIADLLNLWIPYYPRQSFYRPVWQSEAFVKGKTAIIGNSFSNEYKINAEYSGIFENLSHYENLPLSDKDCHNILNTDRIIFVYTDRAFLQANHQFYQKIDRLIKNGKYLFRHKFSEKNEDITTEGLSFYEDWGRWSEGKSVKMTIKLPDIRHKHNLNLKIVFEAFPFLSGTHNQQKVIVKVNKKEKAVWFFEQRKASPDTSINLDLSEIKNKELHISFEIDNPISPQELNSSIDDQRKLGIGFKTLSIQSD